MSDAGARIAVEGALGRITLNRPQAINALTLAMVRAIDAALRAWEHDPRVAAVLLDGAGERGFCAGGDQRALWDAMRAGDPLPYTFWREEYALNARIARYPKPLAAVMDGITMGGGIGLAGHARHRLATPRLRAAMPEVRIGFSPDVGGTWLLSRAPGELGTHVALTAATIGPADAILCRLADRVVDEAELAALVARLRAGDLAALTLPGAHDSGIDGAPLAAARPWIDACYAGDSLAAILARLRVCPEPAARTAAAAIAAHSPTALTIALRALRTARTLPSLDACLALEYRVSSGFVGAHDYLEGIRAALVDKDRAPRWQPAQIADVRDADVARHFCTADDNLISYRV